MYIYVASSWRNTIQPNIVEILREYGHSVYDFKNEGDGGFHWSQIDPNWKNWNTDQFLKGLENPIAKKGFNCDWEVMQKSDCCVLVMPCGRSAHLEAGYFVGARKKLIIYTHSGEPELMYKMADFITSSINDLISYLRYNT